MEAADAGIKYCVSITDGIPAQDMMRVKRYMKRYRQEKQDGVNRSKIVQGLYHLERAF